MRNIFLKLAIRGKIAAASIALPFVAFAQQPIPLGAVRDYRDVENVLFTVMDWIFSILILLAVVFVLVAAFKYLTAAGDPEKVKSASSTLIYAAIAVAVAILARGIPALIGSFLGTDVNV